MICLSLKNHRVFAYRQEQSTAQQQYHSREEHVAFQLFIYLQIYKAETFGHLLFNAIPLEIENYIFILDNVKLLLVVFGEKLTFCGISMLLCDLNYSKEIYFLKTHQDDDERWS